MKNKTKVIVGLAAMLAGTVGVAGVSTFAWFTTQNSAKVTFTDMVVRGDTTNISVTYDAANQPASNGIQTNATTLADGVTVDHSTTSLVAISGAKTQVIDLSGNGQEFFHPVNYKSDTGHANSITSGVQNGASTYYVSFNIGVTNNGNQPTDVFINSGSTVAAVTGTGINTTASEAAAKATRVSIWQLADQYTNVVPASTATIRTLWSPATTDTTPLYLGTDQTATTGVQPFGLTDSTVYQNTIRSSVGSGEPAFTKEEKVFKSGTYNVAPAAVQGTIGDDTAAPTVPTTIQQGQWLCHLPALNSKKVLNIEMWIEGTDDNGTETCIDGHVGLTLNLTAAQRTAVA